MNKPLSVLVLSALVLSGCGSSLNPFNWFGNSQSQPVVTDDATVNPLIPQRRASIFRDSQDNTYLGAYIGEVSELLIERRPGGAIIRATGVVDRQKYFDVRLLKNEEESTESVLTYDFKAIQVQSNAGPKASRTVVAAVWLTDNQLEGIREIRVKGARNLRSSRR